MRRRQRSRRRRSSGGRGGGSRGYGGGSRRSAGARRSFFRGSRSRKTSGWRWLLTGVVAGTVATGMLYLNEHPLEQWQEPLKISMAEQSRAGESPAAQKFEFYQLLAKPSRANSVAEAKKGAPTRVAATAPKVKALGEPARVVPGGVIKASLRPKVKPAAGSVFESKSRAKARTKARAKATAKTRAIVAHAAVAKKPVVKRQVSRDTYVLRVAAFPQRQGAEKLRRQMHTWGIKAQVVAAQVAHKMWYRVIIGPTLSEARANSLRALLVERGLQAQVQLVS
jgi:cell division protein FtsN